MKSLEAIYKTDEKLAFNGVPITVGYNEKDDPIVMIVAEAGNPDHLKAQRRHDRALEASRHNTKRRRYVMAQIITDGILRSWNGVLDSKQKEVPYSKKAAMDALIKYDRLQIDIISAADDPMNYRIEEEITGKEDSEKN